MKYELTLSELCELAEEQFSKDWYPRELPNGMWEVAKGIFTNKKGMEKFDEYEVQVQSERPENR